MLFYRASLPLSRQTLNFAAGIIRRHRISIGSLLAEAEPRAAGPPGPGLPAQRRDVRQPRGRVRGRHGHCLAVRGGDGRAARRTGAEAAQGGPGRGEGRARLRRPGRDADPHRPGRRGPALLLRQAQEARHEPAGHRRSPRRHPLGLRSAARLGPRQEGRVDAGRPGRTGGRLVTLADKGYQGSTYAKIPYKGKNKPDSQKQANKAHAKLRAPGERANAQLKTWKILTKLRCCPWRAGQLARAIHVLQLRET